MPHVTFLWPTRAHKMVYLLLLQILPYRGNESFMTKQIYLQRVMSTYLDALRHQVLFSWTFAFVWRHTQQSNPVPPHVQVFLDLGLCVHWNISAVAGRQGWHITAVYQSRFHESWMQ